MSKTRIEGCLLCNKPEKSYIPSPGLDFICGSCVQVLLGFSRDDLKAYYEKATEDGFLRNAKAINVFISERT